MKDMNLAEFILSTISFLGEPCEPVEHLYSAKLIFFLQGMVALGKRVPAMIAYVRNGLFELTAVCCLVINLEVVHTCGRLLGAVVPHLFGTSAR